MRNVSLSPRRKGGSLQMTVASSPGLEVIKLEFILRLKIKHTDWVPADTCLQAANHCALFWVWDYNLEVWGMVVLFGIHN